MPITFGFLKFAHERILYMFGTFPEIDVVSIAIAPGRNRTEKPPAARVTRVTKQIRTARGGTGLGAKTAGFRLNPIAEKDKVPGVWKLRSKRPYFFQCRLSATDDKLPKSQP